MRAAVTPALAPDFKLDVKNITGGTPYIESRYALATNAPYVIELARQTEKEGFDGIFVSDFDFCGVEPSRETVSIPVVGGFRPSALTAILLGQRFSIISIVDATVDLQREHAYSFGILENLASIRPIGLPVDELDDLDRAIPKAYELARRCILEDGADVILLGCTGFIGVAAPVAKLLAEDGLPAPVLDPNITAIVTLQGLVRAGQRQSPLTYACPPNLQGSGKA
ncbi:MAG: racemase [Alphaproteobacteria bacterium]|nr:racemase [Alphaproteobacteria bacterium]